MRYLKPKHMMEVNGKTYPIIFSLDVIDELQDISNMPVEKLVLWLSEKKRRVTAVKAIIKVMTGEEINDNYENYSILLMKAFIEQIKTKNPPKKPVKTDSEIDFINVERWFFIAKAILGFSEKEAWGKTIGQIGTLMQERAEFLGLNEGEKEQNVDDVIPY